MFQQILSPAGNLAIGSLARRLLRLFVLASTPYPSGRLPTLAYVSTSGCPRSPSFQSAILFRPFW